MSGEARTDQPSDIRVCARLALAVSVLAYALAILAIGFSGPVAVLVGCALLLGYCVA